jgi:type II secretory pathway pseudopilin PulG
MRIQPSMPASRGLTLPDCVVLLIIVGVLAAIILPQIEGDCRYPRGSSNLRSQLQTVRSQIELYNVQNPGDPYDADGAPGGLGGPGLGNFWAALIQGNYLQSEPINPLTPNPAVNDPTAVAAAAAPNGAWVWAESIPGEPWTLSIYAVGEDGNLYGDPDTGQPY